MGIARFSSDIGVIRQTMGGLDDEIVELRLSQQRLSAVARRLHDLRHYAGAGQLDGITARLDRALDDWQQFSTDAHGWATRLDTTVTRLATAAATITPPDTTLTAAFVPLPSGALEPAFALDPTDSTIVVAYTPRTTYGYDETLALDPTQTDATEAYSDPTGGATHAAPTPDMGVLPDDTIQHVDTAPKKHDGPFGFIADWWDSIGDGWKEVISGLISCIPVIGTAKMLIEAAIGQDLLTGRKLEPWERAMYVGCAFAGPLAGLAGKGLSAGARLATRLPGAARAASLISKGATATKAFTTVVKGTRAATMVAKVTEVVISPATKTAAWVTKTVAPRVAKVAATPIGRVVTAPVRGWNALNRAQTAFDHIIESNITHAARAATRPIQTARRALQLPKNVVVDLKNLSPFKVVQMQRTDGTVITMVAKNDDFGNVMKITRRSNSSTRRILVDFRLASDPRVRISEAEVIAGKNEKFVWTDDYKEWLRRQTPSSMLAKAMAPIEDGLKDGSIPLRNGIGEKDDFLVVVPFHVTQDLTTITFNADHTVAFNKIIDLPGFKDLSAVDQLKIVNSKYNIVALEERANKSKQALSWDRWMKHGELGDVPQSIKDYMSQFEEPILKQLQEDIGRLLRGEEAESGKSLKELLGDGQYPLPPVDTTGRTTSSISSVALPTAQGVDHTVGDSQIP